VIRTSLTGAPEAADVESVEEEGPARDRGPRSAGPHGVPAEFHPAVAAWFRRRFPGGATEPQRRAWPRILSGEDVLVASPTGSGKTLTGFLVAIDAAYRAQSAGEPECVADAPPPGPGVVYISPLRALAVDVEENLRTPLEGIAAEAERLGLAPPALTVAVRTGDTPAAERAAMRSPRRNRSTCC